MIKFCLQIIFFLFSLWVTAQNRPIRDNAWKENKKEQNNTKLKYPGSGLLSNEISNDSVYHEGALLFMDLNMNARNLKSSFCISCHDGIFITAGHTTTNVGNPEDIDPTAIFRGDHPVAFAYTSEMALSKNYLRDPKTTLSGLGGTVSDDLLVEGRVECVTCHNIFFKRGKKKKYEVLNLDYGGTRFCLTCHKR